MEQRLWKTGTGHIFVCIAGDKGIQIDPFLQQFFMNPKQKKTLENTGFPRVLMFF